MRSFASWLTTLQHPNARASPSQLQRQRNPNDPAANNKDFSRSITHVEIVEEGFFVFARPISLAGTVVPQVPSHSSRSCHPERSAVFGREVEGSMYLP